MKSSMILGLALVLVAAFCFVTVADAPKADAPKADAPKEVTVKGMVSVVKNDKGEVTEITIKSGWGKEKEVVYQVNLDDNGKKLAEENGNMVEAKGTVEEKDGKKILTVTSFKKIERPAPKEKK